MFPHCFLKLQGFLFLTFFGKPLMSVLVSLKTTLKHQNLLWTLHNSHGFACTLSLSLNYMHIFPSCLQGKPLGKESWETLSNILTYNCKLPHVSLTCQKDAMTSEWTLVSPKGSLLSLLSTHKAAFNPAVLGFSFTLELPGNSSLRDSVSRGGVGGVVWVHNQHFKPAPSVILVQVHHLWEIWP